VRYRAPLFFCPAATVAALFVSERGHRINPASSPGGNPAGQCGDTQQNRRDTEENRKVDRALRKRNHANEITSASIHPIAAPQAIPPKFSRIICRTTRPLVAPKANRTPISLVRLATA